MADRLQAEVTLNLSGWEPKTPLLDYLLRTGQITSLVNENGHCYVTVRNQVCSKGHLLTPDNIYKEKDPRYNTVAHKCLACKRSRDKARKSSGATVDMV